MWTEEIQSDMCREEQMNETRGKEQLNEVEKSSWIICGVKN